MVWALLVMWCQHDYEGLMIVLTLLHGGSAQLQIGKAFFMLMRGSTTGALLRAGSARAGRCSMSQSVSKTIQPTGTDVFQRGFEHHCQHE